ncbi:MAG: DUF2796 domain-containing protein [Gammaproteobacteria bacterium]
MPYRPIPYTRGYGLCKASITMMLGIVIGTTMAGTAAGETADAVVQSPGPGNSGLSRLNIVLDGTRLLITLVGPARDFSGLEHPPDVMKSGATLFLMPSDAWCRPVSAAVSTATEDGSPVAALQATWQFQCSEPAALNWIEAHLLAVFPDTQKLATSVTTPDGTKSVVLTPGTPRILLPRPK